MRAQSISSSAQGPKIFDDEQTRYKIGIVGVIRRGEQPINWPTSPSLSPDHSVGWSFLTPRDQIGSPEPCAQRRVTALHNCADRQASILASVLATFSAAAFTLETESHEHASYELVFGTNFNDRAVLGIADEPGIAA